MDHTTLGNTNPAANANGASDHGLISPANQDVDMMDLANNQDQDHIGDDNDDDDEAALFGKQSDDDDDDAELSHFAGADADIDQDAAAADLDEDDPMDVDRPLSPSPKPGSGSGSDQDQPMYDQAEYQGSPARASSPNAYDELPHTVLKLGDHARFMPDDTVYQLDLPRTLRVDPMVFDPDQYMPLDPNVPDHTLLIHTESTIRWRNTTDPTTGGPTMQSNAHLIEWSDGSLGLMLGDEIYPISTSRIPPHHHLVHIQATDDALVSEVPLKEKMHVKMASGAAGTKRFRATLQSSQATGRRAGTKYIESDRDFEKEHADKLRVGKEMAKAEKQLEAKRRREARKYGKEDEDGAGAGSGGGAGGSRRARASRRGRTRASAYSDDEEEDEDEASESYDEDEYGGDAGGCRRSSRRSGASRSGGAGGAGGGDDLDGFVVDDDDAIVNYDDDDEAEEQAELMMESRRRTVADNRASRAEALARQRGGASQSSPVGPGEEEDEEEDDQEYSRGRSSSSATGGARSRRAVSDDD